MAAADDTTGPVSVEYVVDVYSTGPEGECVTTLSELVVSDQHPGYEGRMIQVGVVRRFPTREAADAAGRKRLGGYVKSYAVRAAEKAEDNPHYAEHLARRADHCRRLARDVERGD